MQKHPPASDTRFGHIGCCATCLSLPCSCLATAASFGLVALAGLGLIKVVPRLFKAARSALNRISPNQVQDVQHAIETALKEDRVV